MLRIIQTSRLQLRAIDLSHAQDLNREVCFNIEYLSKWLPWATHAHSLKETKDFINNCMQAWSLETEFAYSIFEDDKLVGATSIRLGKNSEDEYNIGYWISKSCAGRGLATEAARALVKVAFLELEAQRVGISCNKYNIASCRIAEKLGFICKKVEQGQALYVKVRE